MQEMDQRVRRASAVGLLLALTLTGLQGCTTKELSGLTDLPFPAFGSVTVTPGAVTLAVGTTQQLTAVALDTTGAPLPGAAAPTFHSQDTNRVAVDANGVLRAKTVGSTRVTARIQSEGVTLEAATIVTVTENAATAASFAITPEMGMMAVGEGLSLTATAYTSGGTPISETGEASYVSTNPKVARIDNGSVSGISPGQAKIIGRMTVYGKAFVDTVTVTVTNANYAVVYVYPAGDFYMSRRVTFQPAVVKIAPGGTVVWANYSAWTNWGEAAQKTMDVTFDNPNATPDGNIPAFSTGEEIGRTFPTVGTYTYKSTTNGETGKIIVQ